MSDDAPVQGVCLPWPRLVCGNAGARLGKVVVAGTQAWWLQLTGGQVTRFLSRLFNFGWIRVHTVSWAVQWWPLSRGQQTICPQLTKHDTSYAQRFACRDKKTYLFNRESCYLNGLGRFRCKWFMMFTNSKGRRRFCSVILSAEWVCMRCCCGGCVCCPC